MIQISLKVDEIEDQEIAAWVKSFQGRRSRLLSLNIRKAIKFYLENSTGISWPKRIHSPTVRGIKIPTIFPNVFSYIG